MGFDQLPEAQSVLQSRGPAIVQHGTDLVGGAIDTLLPLRATQFLQHVRQHIARVRFIILKSPPSPRHCAGARCDATPRSSPGQAFWEVGGV